MCRIQRDACITRCQSVVWQLVVVWPQNIYFLTSRWGTWNIIRRPPGFICVCSAEPSSWRIGRLASVWSTCVWMRPWYHSFLRKGSALQWRHNDHNGVSNHQPHDCLLNRLFMRRSRKTSKLRVIGLCEGNLPVTGEVPTQMASSAENVSIWWRHHYATLLYSIRWKRSSLWCIEIETGIRFHDY